MYNVTVVESAPQVSSECSCSFGFFQYSRTTYYSNTTQNNQIEQIAANSVSSSSAESRTNATSDPGEKIVPTAPELSIAIATSSGTDVAPNLHSAQSARTVISNNLYENDRPVCGEGCIDDHCCSNSVDRCASLITTLCSFNCLPVDDFFRSCGWLMIFCYPQIIVLNSCDDPHLQEQCTPPCVEPSCFMLTPIGLSFVMALGGTGAFLLTIDQKAAGFSLLAWSFVGIIYGLVFNGYLNIISGDNSEINGPRIIHQLPANIHDMERGDQEPQDLQLSNEYAISR